MAGARVRPPRLALSPPSTTPTACIAGRTPPALAAGRKARSKRAWTGFRPVRSSAAVRALENTPARWAADITGCVSARLRPAARVPGRRGFTARLAERTSVCVILLGSSSISRERIEAIQLRSPPARGPWRAPLRRPRAPRSVRLPRPASPPVSRSAGCTARIAVADRAAGRMSTGLLAFGTTLILGMMSTPVLRVGPSVCKPQPADQLALRSPVTEMRCCGCCCSFRTNFATRVGRAMGPNSASHCAFPPRCACDAVLWAPAGAFCPASCRRACEPRSCNIVVSARLRAVRFAKRAAADVVAALPDAGGTASQSTLESSACACPPRPSSSEHSTKPIATYRGHAIGRPGCIAARSGLQASATASASRPYQMTPQHMIAQ